MGSLRFYMKMEKAFQKSGKKKVREPYGRKWSKN